MPFKYTVVCDTLGFIGYDVLEEPEEVLTAIKDVGYDGVDLPGAPDRADPKKLRELVDSLGLEVPEVLGAWAYFHGGEDRDLAGNNEAARRRGINYARKAIDYAAKLDATFFQICAAQPPVYEVPFPKLPIGTLKRNFIGAMQEILPYAEQRGISILFEPLNCYEGYPGVLTTLSEAMDIIKESGAPNLGIQPDVFHMNVGEGSIPKAIRAAGGYVKHFHMNETNHREHGTGHADYRAIIKALKDIKYEGYLAFYMPFTTQEIFNLTAWGYGQSSGDQEKVDRPDLRACLERPLKIFKELEKAG
ncbi:MAG: hypothetical protein CMN58_06140 [Solibacterales bacterium]|uniref:D-tagatose 3-epimerase n=1 Tax=Candidatus Moanibacter tarae TaxID=2200854 RepID=A0A2Z4AIU7_9BACT|nr:MAG: D-tagatose 3-epimerase [Candidatus Moanabacter tarae]MBG99907.1 hypothetical protein [Bryobacterales bacterium]|tara:strand:- start:3485 stop:4396 length:912 start_codon:yes stop_codon:yes gene_type:complete